MAKSDYFYVFYQKNGTLCHFSNFDNGETIPVFIGKHKANRELKKIREQLEDKDSIIIVRAKIDVSHVDKYNRKLLN